MSNKNNENSDLQGLTRLTTEATLGIIDLVEAMHLQILHPPYLPSTPIQRLLSKFARFTYKNISWSTKFIGNSLDKILEQLTSRLGEKETTNEREVMRAVLNGVIGDYLEKKENSLKISMQFRHQGKALLLNEKSIENSSLGFNGKILLMVHGLCMNDVQWTRKSHNHGEALAKELDRTAIYLHYNSGLHISTNGQHFNELLENLLLNWPVPVEELVIIGHSMGGLVTRSALYYGEQEKKNWTKYLQKIIFLGTPHHGAPLEKAGNYVDLILEAVPYAKPFARLGKIRSAGVTDLRHGNLVDEDWKGNDRFEIQEDQRINIPLPKEIACYSIAATIGKKDDRTSHRLLGDSLVYVESALGEHKNPDKNLSFKKENTWMAYENNHFDLLSNLKVYSKIKEWMI